MCPTDSQANTASAPVPGRIGSGRLAAAALAGALVTWMIIVKWYPFYFAGLQFGPGAVPTPEEQATLRLQNWVNPVSLFALFGATLSVALGITAALCRRSICTALIGIPLGAVLGAAFGALAGWCGQWLSDPASVELIDRSRPEAELAIALIMHGACWTITGLGVGLGFALTALKGRNRLYASLGACLGGMLAAPLYQAITLLICLIAPMGGTDLLVPEGSENRLIWFGTAALMIGMGAGGLTGRREKPAKPLDAPPPAESKAAA